MSEKQLYKFALAKTGNNKVHIVGELPSVWVRFWMFVVFGSTWEKFDGEEMPGRSAATVEDIKIECDSLREEIALLRKEIDAKNAPPSMCQASSKHVP